MSEIIAEIGQNHNGDMKLAVQLIHVAKQHGADVAKFQLFDPEKIFKDKSDPWYDYNRKTPLSKDQVRFLAAECERVGIEFMASAFDSERVDWLEEVGVRRHKLASRSIRDAELIQAMVKTGKPILASLGIWYEERFPLIKTAASVEFLYCVSKYPTPLTDLKLADVNFAKYGGFSDHTLGIVASIVAIARGARIIEKHFTLDKSMNGPDHMCSMIPDELTALHKFRVDIAQCL
jgi:sialic acid synthase SpsE